MNRFCLLICLVAQFTFGQKVLPAHIEVKDERLHEYINTNNQLEIIAEGHDWSEGPLWVSELNSLLFSDVPRNIVYKWNKEKGVSEYLKPSGYSGNDKYSSEPGSNGLALNLKGELVLCQHGNRQLAKMRTSIYKPSPNFETIASNYNGLKLNSPNDLATDAKGNFYFTDPPYGLPQRMNSPSKEISFQGVYKVNSKGKIQLLDSSLTRPNGIAFSPDFKKLYVANSDPKKAIWKVYDVQKNGSLENGNTFFDVTPLVGTKKGLPDGLKVNREGVLFASGPGGILIFHPDGTHLGTINTGQATSNCAFNEDESVLFITADSYVLKLNLN